MKLIYFIGIILLAFSSCDKKQTTFEYDEDVIQNYLAEANINATKHESGIYYIIEEEGDGQHPTIYDNIIANYKGYYVDSFVFDSGKLDLPLNSLYRGWQYGLPLFGKGGKGKLFLPRHLADNQSVMIFEVELLHVWRP